MQKYYISEIFGNTIQGEGKYTSRNTIWLRLFSCNLQCQGFSQKYPTRPETWLRPHMDLNVSDYKELTDLPVFEYGCDTSYSVSRKFRDLCKQYTIKEICDKLEDLLRSSTNPSASFLHKFSKSYIHLAFTGGEPLLSTGQKVILAVLKEFKKRNNSPQNITIETNGTQLLCPEFSTIYKYLSGTKPEVFMSVSPKLFTVSGERPEKAIKPKVIYQYYNLYPEGQLKFVLGIDDNSWKELFEVIKHIRDLGCTYPVWIMPLGATKDQQEDISEKVAEKALSYGFNVAVRAHCYLFGNAIGK